MALIVFLRGINVGGHKALRPCVLAKELGICDAVNVGAQARLSFANLGYAQSSLPIRAGSCRLKQQSLSATAVI
jgi:hypothetical protein